MNVQVNGLSLAGGTGTAFVAKGLKSATFSLVTASQAGTGNATKVTGSWTCGPRLYSNIARAAR